MRLNMKKTYMEDRRPGGLVKKEAILQFVRNMGSNLFKSIQKESSLNRNMLSRSKKMSKEDLDRSTWKANLESSTLEELTQPSNPYTGRKVGITARVQAEQEAKAHWSGKKCDGCGKGFNLASSVVSCRGCHKYFHRRTKCIGTSRGIMHNFLCEVCQPLDTGTNPNKTVLDNSEDFTKENNKKYKCNKCGQECAVRFNMKRHMIRKHNNIEEDPVPGETEQENEMSEQRGKTISEILEELDLNHLTEVFEKEKIDMEVLMEMNKDELEKVGVKAFGDRHKIHKAIQHEKMEGNEKDNSKNKEAKQKKEEIQTKRKNDDPQENSKYDDEKEDDPSKQSMSVDPCSMCELAQVSPNPHVCRVCGGKVCNFYCSVQDPKSDNEQHRIHKYLTLCNIKEVKSLSEHLKNMTPLLEFRPKTM